MRKAEMFGIGGGAVAGGLATHFIASQKVAEKINEGASASYDEVSMFLMDGAGALIGAVIGSMLGYAYEKLKKRTS